LVDVDRQTSNDAARARNVTTETRKEIIAHVKAEAGRVSAILHDAHLQWPFTANMETLAGPGEAATQRVTITANDPQVTREVCTWLAREFERVGIEGKISGF
jgi:hypothetical protein